MKIPSLITVGIISAFLIPAPAAFAGTYSSQARPSDVQHLKKVFRQHVFLGRRFDTRLRAATGNPRIVVFDHRLWGADGSQCSYITYRGKRAIVCD